MGIDDMMYPGRPIPAELIERYQDMADGSLHLGLIGFKMQSDIHRYYAMPGARRYAHDLPRSPYYRGAI